MAACKITLQTKCSGAFRNHAEGSRTISAVKFALHNPDAHPNVQDFTDVSHFTDFP